MEMHQNQNTTFSFLSYYRYLDGSFRILLFIGILNSIVAGACLQGGIFVFAKSYSEYQEGKPNNEIRDDIEWLAYVQLMLAGVLPIACILFVSSLHLVGQKVVYEVRLKYIRAIITKDSEWFEERNLEAIPTAIHTHLIDIENGSGKTVGFLIYSFSSFFFGVMYGFLLGALFAT